MHYDLWGLAEQGLHHRSPWIRGLVILGLCLLVGFPAGAVIGLLGPIYGSALLIAVAVGYVMLRSVMAGLAALIGVVCLLPFAALPIDIGFSPTFLDLVLGAVFFVWAGRLVTHQDGEFVAPPPTGALLAFLALAVVSFVAGLSHSRISANVLRHFAEIVLSVLLFLLVTNSVRTKDELRFLVRMLILAGFLAAFIGVVLYLLPENLTVRLLSTLRVVRYPSGSAVLRYIEDDPSQALRATSTSVDPNVLGGLLIFVTTLTAAQTLARDPILPRRWLVLMLGTMATCMILTFSRGSFVGLAAALGLVALLRYRRLLWIGLAAMAIILILPVTQEYVQHFLEGVQGQDLATQMRFGEYRDSLRLIARYPWFGVGFAGTPDIDTYIGVSNVYLLIAEEMGVFGLGAFLLTLFVYLSRFFSTLRRTERDSDLEPILLGTGAAVAGAMVGGMLDHYLFNLVFPHAAALMWLVIGLGTVSIQLALREAQPEPMPSPVLAQRAKALPSR